MRYIIILCLFIMSCSENIKQDPKCLDGYFIVRPPDYFAFCLKAYISTHAIYGTTCYDAPKMGKGVTVDIILTEGMVTETKCYNTVRE